MTMSSIHHPPPERADGLASLHPTIKALTIYQPWASLIALGEKKIETREWYTPHRGPLAIHAGLNDLHVQNIHASVKRALHSRQARVEAPFVPAFLQMCEARGLKPLEWLWNLPLGEVVGLATMTRCETMTSTLIKAQTPQELAFGGWGLGRHAWVLENAYALKPTVKAKGAQGIWSWTR
jgi:activating signal cointegrator 1